MISIPRSLVVGALAASALLLEGCNDGLLHAPAPAAPASVRMSASLSRSSSNSSSSSGFDPDAFDRADQLFLRFRVGDDVRLEQTVPFSPSAAGTTVRLDVPLRQLTETMTAELEVRSANRALFRGSTSATLTSGVQTPLDFTLDPVVASVACGGNLVVLGAYGQTAQLPGVALFATGDTVRDVPVTWSVPSTVFAVSMSESGLATALQDGDAIATCAAQGLTATRSIRVFAVVSKVQVSPPSATLVVGNTLGLTATLDDARGNLITAPRPLTWSSAAAPIATVNTTGVVTGVTAGSARISATSDTVVGGSDVTVVFTSTVVTNAAVNITGSGATLLGTVNPRGAATNAWFEFGTDSALTGAAATPTKSAGSGTADVALIETIGGLTPNTKYFFRAVSSGVGGTARGAILSFVTSRPPTVQTADLDPTVYQSYTIRGFVTPNGNATDGWFQYGTVSTLATFLETSKQAVGNGLIPVTTSQPISGLLPFTTYYYRAVASSVGGTALGSIASFRTGGAPMGHTPTGVLANCIAKTTCANMASSANPNGALTEAWFEYGTSSALSTVTSTAHTRLGSGSTDAPFSASVTMNPQFPFWFRAVAANALGTYRSDPVQAFFPTTIGSVCLDADLGTARACVGPDGKLRTANDSGAAREINPNVRRERGGR